ncbi:MAG: ZIP family metal transporter [Crocinitomicaceae bacterium]|nr:ZIP family metal transporter [Crocinitomicaceae bacterium]MCF8409667.1 ZIP family metal transporter [Crocinitomicaceae bacterium]MCF8443963.1 ZIP family metal transporter [Crocinitomicaceae bacterium]
MLNSFTVISGFLGAVVLGGFTVSYLQATNKTQLIKLLLAFSGGFMLSIAFTHFIPELYSHQANTIGYYILLGFLIQLILEFFSGGIEHGHVHIHKGEKMPWALFISLSVHSIIEGIPVGNALSGVGHIVDHGHGHDINSLFFGILFHQIPVAIALMTLLLKTDSSRLKAWIILLLFGLMTPIGVIVGMTVEAEHLGLNEDIILAVVVGIFLHISTTIIFETSENHKFNIFKLVSILIGCTLAFGMNLL